MRVHLENRFKSAPDVNVNRLDSNSYIRGKLSFNYRRQNRT